MASISTNSWSIGGDYSKNVAFSKEILAYVQLKMDTIVWVRIKKLHILQKGMNGGNGAKVTINC